MKRDAKYKVIFVGDYMVGLKYGDIVEWNGNYDAWDEYYDVKKVGSELSGYVPKNKVNDYLIEIKNGKEIWDI